MAQGRILESIELIKKACTVAMKAHPQSSDESFFIEKIINSPDVVFAFPGTWLLSDWYAGEPFGEVEIKLDDFRSLRSVGNNVLAMVNKTFLDRFNKILPSLKIEVDICVKEKKNVVFTGHSSGGAVAILATVWFLENYARPITPLCVTFGSPLVGNYIFSHALGRENWSSYFIHFVLRCDIVPRILLAPFSSIKQQLELVFAFFDPKSMHYNNNIICNSREAVELYMEVRRNASVVARHAACKLMGSTSLLLQTALSFVDLSPYRPSGTYVFCSENGKMVVLTNPDAVLQLLYYSFELNNEAEMALVASNSLRIHLAYESMVMQNIVMQNMVYLDELEEIPLSLDIVADSRVATINMALNDLGPSAGARLCIRASGAWEKQKMKNQADVDGKKEIIKKSLRAIENYREKHSGGRLGYYDAFKLSKDREDFQANVERMKLTGIWDEILEMLKKYELPDGFEGRKEWIELGTKFRRLVEPLDIANYHRHLKNEDTGTYLVNGRPSRYRFTQRWLEQSEKMPDRSSRESTLWAEVEELCISTSKRGQVEDVKIRDEIQKLEYEVKKWSDNGLCKDLFCKESTFSKWWNTLPVQFKRQSCIASYMNPEN